MTAALPVIEDVTAAAYRFPLDKPESDGTLTWDATVAVVVTIRAGAHTGLGWTYSAAAAADVIREKLVSALRGRPVSEVEAAWRDMHRAARNLGTAGLVMQAISAVDIALWDLKARCLDLPLVELFGAVRPDVEVYGSGGFTSLDAAELAEQVRWWSSAGCRLMKIKIGEAWGSREDRDIARVRSLREYAGDGVGLMVDANGAYARKQAARVGRQLDELGVIWFEEPVTSDDPAGLALLRDRLTADVSAGEYVAEVDDAIRLTGALDCLQLDVTRCGGYTGFRRCASLAAAAKIDVSGHCAPALHAPIAASTPNLRHVEWFVDHARLEPQLIDGVPDVIDGRMAPRREPGHGYRLSERAADYRIQ